MQFLDRFAGADRERLLAAGRVRTVQPGEYLIRRGERGGDIFLVEEGAFEVLDTRTTPEVVLHVAGPGTVLGEMAYLDSAARNADVRAAGRGGVRVWEQAALTRVLDGEPAFAVVFYRALAHTVVDRLRALATSAVSGGMRGAGAGEAAGTTRAEAHDIAKAAQDRWLEADGLLRRDPHDRDAVAAIAAGLFQLIQSASEWIAHFTDPAEMRAAGSVLARELRPYFVRASLAEQSLDPPSRRSGDPRLLAHVLLEQPRGAGDLGRAMDAALLALPTCAGIRRRTEIVGRTLIAALPVDRSSNVMLVNATCGAVLARLMPSLARGGSSVRVIDGSREALSFLDAGLPSRPRSVQLKLVQADIADLAMGRSPIYSEPQNFVLVDGLVEYLPDRLVAALMSWVGKQLAPGGVVLITALAPSADQVVFDHMLGWPMVRRPARQLRALIEAAGLIARVVAGRPEDPDPAVVVLGRRPPELD